MRVPSLWFAAGAPLVLKGTATATDRQRLHEPAAAV